MNRLQSNNRISQEVSASALSIHRFTLARNRLTTVTTPIIITILFAQGVGTSF